MAVTKKTVRGLNKVCRSVVKSAALKTDGTLKKGFKYIKGGKIVKVETVKKKPVKKKAVKKKTIKKASKPKR